MKLRITGIGISGPGLTDWSASAAVLSGSIPYSPDPYRPGGRSPLSGAERRRASAVTRLALEAVMEAAGPDLARCDIPAIFASSGGETDTCDTIFDQLSRPERMLSPTQFHNSVHNAASGYWGIASGSHQMVTNVACFDDTFAAGLLEASALIATEGCEVLLVAYDVPPPYPIGPFRPLVAPFATALRLGPDHSDDGLAELDIAFADRDVSVATTMASDALETLRMGNPAARALPLLAVIAAGKPATVYVACSGPGLLRLDINPR